MNKLSQVQLIDWANQITILTADEKKTIIDGIKGSKWDGSKIASCKDRADLQDGINIKSDIGKKLWSEITLKRENDKKIEGNKALDVFARASSLDNIDNNNNNNNDKNVYKFSPMVMINNKLKTLKGEVTLSTTVLQLKKMIYEEEIGPINENNEKEVMKKVKKMQLNNENTGMDNNKTLKDCGVISQAITLTVVSRVIGGAQQYSSNASNDDGDDDNNYKYNRELNIFHPLISKIKTKEVDSITYSDDDNEWRVKLSCNHVISSITMLMYIEHLFEQAFTHNYKLVSFVCPVPKCNQSIEWSLMAAIACLNKKELIHYSSIIEKHKQERNGIKHCPHCHILIEKLKALSQNRVHCVSCNGSDFCWTCLQKWKGDGIQICGNKNCVTHYIVQQIQNCPLKIPEYIKVEMPSIRACPNCLHLIIHDDQDNRCKHVDCPNQQCKTSFCFVCLSIKNKITGKYSCNSHVDTCQVAPRQQLK